MRPEPRAGVTLLELLIAIALIGIMAAVAGLGVSLGKRIALTDANAHDDISE